jgi:hypothetical protein
MKYRLFVTLLFLLLVSSTVINTVFAQTATVGVSIGETFDYDYRIFWGSTNTTATPPSEYIEINKTKTIQMRIIEISGTTINLQCIKNYENGTQKVESGNINIDTGTIDVPYGFLIISANLSANQKMYPSGGNQIITSTSFRLYPNGQRETNCYISETTFEITEIYFDKLKGIAVDYYYEMNIPSESYTTTIREVLTNTNSDVWTIPELSTLLVPLSLFAGTAALLVAKVAKKRRRL